MITTKIRVSFKEYVKLLYGLTYRKPMLIGIVSFGFLMLTWIIAYYTRLLDLPKPEYYQYITVILILVVQPLVIYITIWRNYYSSNHLKEPMEIEFTRNLIKIRGESFYTELVWEKLFKINELSNWFMFYENNISAVLVPKKSLTKKQETELKKLLQNITGPDLHLKKEVEAA